MNENNKKQKTKMDEQNPCKTCMSKVDRAINPSICFRCPYNAIATENNRKGISY